MELSAIGKIVEECWKEIPLHFTATRLGAFQIMPDHVHGVIAIRENPPAVSRSGVQLNAPTKEPFARSPRKNTLSVIVRTFKAAVTTKLRTQGTGRYRSVWQRSFHDRVIRDDTEHFFIERYIMLNPIIWTLDSRNTRMHAMPLDALRKHLCGEYGLDDYALEQVIKHEIEYRMWQRKSNHAE
jgi:REP element-mobilizing transposase RayT